MLLEAGAEIGGRVATRRIEGFACDRGFQVLPAADPTVRRELDLQALQVGRFHPGALVFRDGKQRVVADPLRMPSTVIGQVVAGLGSWRERLALARWTMALKRQRGEPQPCGMTTAEALQQRGLSGVFAQAFVRPWLAGITLDRSLQADIGATEAYLAAFARGPAVLPAGGMAAIPAQIAKDLPPAVIQCDTPVRAVEAQAVVLADGSRQAAAAVVVATAARPAAALLGRAEPATGAAVRAIHFAVPSPAPIKAPWLALDGDGPGPIASLVFPSRVTTGYSPAGWELATVAVLDGDAPDDPVPSVRARLQAWFGDQVAQWRVLAVDEIPHALPAQDPRSLSERPPLRTDHGCYRAGDAVSRPGIGAAMASGVAAAEALLADGVAAA